MEGLIATLEPAVQATIRESWVLGVLLWPYWKLIFAFFAGMVGSAAYITALYFRFIGENDSERRVVMKPFMKRYSVFGELDKLKCFWYCCVGGAVAVIFQVDVPTFVAVQSLILGATWPAVISQFLSGKMVAPARDDIKQDIEKKPTDIDGSLIEKIRSLQEEENEDEVQ